MKNKIKYFAALLVISLAVFATIESSKLGLNNLFGGFVSECEAIAEVNGNSRILKLLKARTSSNTCEEIYDRMMPRQQLRLSNIPDLRLVKYLKNLESLDLQLGAEFVDWDSFGELSELKKLTISSMNSAVIDLSFLTHLNKLEVLHLAGLKVKSGVTIGTAKNLQELIIVKGDLVDLSLIEACPVLKKLDLSFNRIQSVEALKNCKNLEVLVLSSNKVQSLEPLSSLPQLKYLTAIMNEVTNFTGIENSESLLELKIAPRPDQILKIRQEGTCSSAAALNNAVKLFCEKLGL